MSEELEVVEPKKRGRVLGSTTGLSTGGQDPNAPNTLMTGYQYCKLMSLSFIKYNNLIRIAQLPTYGMSGKGVDLYRRCDLDEFIASLKGPKVRDNGNNTVEFPTDFTPVDELGSLDRKRELECERIRLDIDIKLQKYVPVDDVRTQLLGLVKLIQQRLMVIYPRSLPNKLYTLSVRDMQAVIAEEGKAFLNELRTVAPTLIGDSTVSDNGVRTDSIGVG